jgi:hypothetical protein
MVWYSATKMGEAVRASAYWTTSSSLVAGVPLHGVCAHELRSFCGDRLFKSALRSLMI